MEACPSLDDSDDPVDLQTRTIVHWNRVRLAVVVEPMEVEALVLEPISRSFIYRWFIILDRFGGP